MELQIQKENIYVKKRIGKKTKKIVIEKDYILPDNKKDFIKKESENIITFINKKELSENKVKIEGGAELRIIYLIPEEKNKVLRLEENFSEIIELEGITQESDIKEKIDVIKIEINALNERKIHYKIELEITIYASTKENIDLISQISNQANIELLNQKMEIENYLGFRESKIAVKEKINIDNMQEKIEILKIKPKINNIETKISYNKILIKANCLLKCIYQIESGMIYLVQKEIPIMGFLDVENVEENSKCKIDMNLKNINISESKSELKSEIEVELEIGITGDIYKTKSINIIKDLYAISGYENKNKKEIISLEKINEEKENYELEEKTVIEDINQIYDQEYKIKNVKKENEKIYIEIEAIYLYSSFENQLLNKKEQIYKIEINSKTNINKEDLKIIKEETVLLPDSSIQTKLKITSYANLVEKLEIITSIELENKENREEYNMIIYLVKKEDTLWEIAKKFQSTIKEIKKINNIEDESKIKIGDKLYIPRVI